ncbi:MAG: hypothetical protein H6592_14545 [Flavobacteriales bacterium]|nr:hypothetical protein [Flavobacteriales bacterium]
MTFYNIIFGILFVGACQQFLFALISRPEHLIVSAVIALMVINDAVHTSNYFEGEQSEPKEYQLVQKWIDLFSFVVLGLAILSISELPDPQLTQLVDQRFTFFHEEWFTWLLLGVYWISATLWNIVDGAFSSSLVQPWPVGMKIYSASIILFFLVNAYLFWKFKSAHCVPLIYPIAAFLGPLPYIFILKHRYEYYGILPPEDPPDRIGDSDAIKASRVELRKALQAERNILETWKQSRQESIKAKRQVRTAQRNLKATIARARRGD